MVETCPCSPLNSDTMTVFILITILFGMIAVLITTMVMHDDYFYTSAAPLTYQPGELA